MPWGGFGRRTPQPPEEHFLWAGEYCNLQTDMLIAPVEGMGYYKITGDSYQMTVHEPNGRPHTIRKGQQLVMGRGQNYNIPVESTFVSRPH